jgi:hypothetical protein
MKTKSCFFIGIFILLCLSANLYSRVWRVNNRPNISADFKTLQGAIDSSYVLAGDTIYLEASTNSYGFISCNKKIIIIGTGYFLNQLPQTQAWTVASSIAGDCGHWAITFGPGSQGSKLIGVTVASMCSFGIQIRTSNICIQRCYVTESIGLFDSVNNTLIMQNYVGGGIGSNGGSGSDLLISNNLIGSGVGMDINHDGTLQNNVFTNYSLDLNNFTLQNNIMTNPGSTFNGNGNCNSSNNMSTGTAFGTSNNNLANVVADSIFACWSDCSASSTDGRYQLKANSPAKGTGFGGLDMGIFGGPNPYVLSGMPNIPTIYEFSIGNNNDTIKIDVKAKSHYNP